MGNQPFSICQKQNQGKSNFQAQNLVTSQKVKKISLNKNNQLTINANNQLSNFQNHQQVNIKRSPQIDKIYKNLIQKQPLKHETTIPQFHNQIQNKSQWSKICLQKKNPLCQKYKRNQKHLIYENNQNENAEEVDYFQDQMRDLNIFDQVYYIQTKKANHQTLNGSFHLYSIATGQNLKYIQTQFKNGEIASKDMIIITQKGNFYRGGFSNNLFNGKGFIHFNNGVQMKGTFKNGFLQGRGEQTQRDGGRFEGMFKKGKKQGKGQLVWRQKNNQNVSNINFQQTKKTSSHLKEIFFQGYFKQNKMNGLGHLITPNYEYWGPFVDNMKQGKGTIMLFPQKTKIQCWFEQDQIQGYGVKTFANGKIQKGFYGIDKQN